MGPRGGIATGTPRTSSKPSAHDGVPAIVDEVRSAFGLVEDHAVEASAGLFRQSSSESEDASSNADDICEESNEEELKAGDVASEPLPPERALELTHTISVSVDLRQYSRSKLRRVGRPALYQCHKVHHGEQFMSRLPHTDSSGKYKCKLHLDKNRSFAQLDAELLKWLMVWRGYGY